MSNMCPIYNAKSPTKRNCCLSFLHGAKDDQNIVYKKLVCCIIDRVDIKKFSLISCSLSMFTKGVECPPIHSIYSGLCLQISP